MKIGMMKLDNYELFMGNICECTYAGSMGNYFGVGHSVVVKKDETLIRLESGEYIRVDDYLSGRKVLYKDTFKKRGDLFIDRSSLVPLETVKKGYVLAKTNR